jgi:XTP/dITP diphosphohydrolase
MELLFGTTNPGKLAELRRLVAALPIRVVSPDDLGRALPEVEEDGETFQENAEKKATEWARFSGLHVLADDSGLCVDALGGAPGVHSAYFAGREGSREQRDARNNAKLLASLGEQRRAHYRCVMAFVRRADDPEPLVAEGAWHGSIARAPRGANGFGYDPLFLLPGRGLTAAELPEEEKNRLSHRGQAAARLVELLR